MLTRPNFEYHGVTKSAAEPPPRTPIVSKSAHILLSYILAERGTNNPIYVDANGFTSEYGLGTTQNHIHHTHQLKYLVTQLSASGTAVTERIKLPDAKKAMMRISLELIPSTIPIYRYDEYWRPVHQYDENTGQYNRIVLGLVNGYRAILHVGVDMYPESYRGLGLAPVMDYRQGSVVGFDGTPLQGSLVGEYVSKLYPIMDIELQDYGDFGNAVTLNFAPSPFAKTGYDTAMTQMIVREKYHTMVTIDGTAETMFGISPVLDSDVTLARAIRLNYVGGRNTLIGNIHSYNDAVAEVCELLVNGQDEFLGEDALIAKAIEMNPASKLEYPLPTRYDAGASTKFQFNILTGKHNSGFEHINGNIHDGENYSGVVFDDGFVHSFSGGSDGYPLDINGNVDKLELLRLYDEAVRQKFESMKDESHPYRNIAKLPFKVWYDSGYSMDTKLVTFNLLKHRPEVTIILATWSVADYGDVIEDTPVDPEPPIDPPEIIISCEGATNTSGCILLDDDGRYDLVIDKVTVLENATPEQILAYTSDSVIAVRCDEDVPVDPEPPIDDGCDCSTDSYVWHTDFQFPPPPDIDLGGTYHNWTANLNLNGEIYSAQTGIVYEFINIPGPFWWVSDMFSALGNILLTMRTIDGQSVRLYDLLSVSGDSSGTNNILFVNNTDKCMDFELYLTIGPENNVQRLTLIPPTSLCPLGTHKSPKRYTAGHPLFFEPAAPFWHSTPSHRVNPLINTEVVISYLERMPANVRPTPIVINHNEGSQVDYPLVEIYLYDAVKNVATVIADLDFDHTNIISTDGIMGYNNPILIDDEILLDRIKKRFDFLKGVSWDSAAHKDIHLLDWTNVESYPSIVRVGAVESKTYHGAMYVDLSQRTFEIGSIKLNKRSDDMFSHGYFVKDTMSQKMYNLANPQTLLPYSTTGAVEYEPLPTNNPIALYSQDVDEKDVSRNPSGTFTVLEPSNVNKEYYYFVFATQDGTQDSFLSVGLGIDRPLQASDFFENDGSMLLNDGTRVMLNFPRSTVESVLDLKLRIVDTQQSFDFNRATVYQSVAVPSLGEREESYTDRILPFGRNVVAVFDYVTFPELDGVDRVEALVTIDGVAHVVEVTLQ